MYSVVNVYVVNQSNKDRKYKFSCLNCHVSFKYFSRAKVRTYKNSKFNDSQFYRVKGNLKFIFYKMVQFFFFF